MDVDRWCREQLGSGIATAELRAVHDWDPLTTGPEAWIVGAASVCFTVDFHAPDGSPARWPSAAESAAFVAACDPTGLLDAAPVRAAGDDHLASIARCAHSVGGFPGVADLLSERTADDASASRRHGSVRRGRCRSVRCRAGGHTGGMSGVTRVPVVADDLDEEDLDGLLDDDEWVERHLRGEAMGAEAERVGLVRCRLTGVRLAGARLVRAELTDVVLADCDLAGTTFEDASLTRVAFTGCRLTGADLGGGRLTDVRFTDCQLDDAGLRMVEATRLVVEGCAAPRLDLYRAKAAGSRWTDDDLTGADLSGTDLTGAWLGGVTLAELKGGSALRGTVIDPAMAIPVGAALLADAGITIDDPWTDPEA